jgi:hypothetical protein
VSLAQRSVIVSLAQRSVIVSLAQRSVIVSLAQRSVIVSLSNYDHCSLSAFHYEHKPEMTGVLNNIRHRVS